MSDQPESKPRAVLYRGGDVYTPADPFATAMLVVGDTIAWVGSDDAAAGHATSADEVVELDGALVTPAFVDGHAHVTETGLALTGLDLHDATSLADVLRRVEDAARRGGGRPILGHRAGTRGTGRSAARRPGPSSTGPPTAASVYLARVDVHSAVVSSNLAAQAGLRGLDGWDDDGRVEREAHHVARDATRAAISPGQREDLQRTALQAAAAVGIGSLHEMSAPHIGTEDDLRALVALSAAEDLPHVLAYRGQLVAVGRRGAGRRRRGSTCPPACCAGWPATCAPTARSAPARRACARTTATSPGTAGTATSTPTRSATTSSPAPRRGCRPAST